MSEYDRIVGGDEPDEFLRAVARTVDEHRVSGVPLTEVQEQQIRDAYGYSASEKRTRAQRDEVANRIRANLGIPEQPFGTSRETAIAHGRQLGEQEADRRNESGTQRENRVRRAAAYAAWEHDGKPVGDWWTTYAKEFGFENQHAGVAGSLERALAPPRRRDG